MSSRFRSAKTESKTKKHLTIIRQRPRSILVNIPRDEVEGNIHQQPTRLRLGEYLTNRFHFAVRLYSDNAQMTSKRGENKEVRYEPQASSVTDVLTTF